MGETLHTELRNIVVFGRIIEPKTCPLVVLKFGPLSEAGPRFPQFKPVPP